MSLAAIGGLLGYLFAIGYNIILKIFFLQYGDDYKRRYKNKRRKHDKKNWMQNDADADYCAGVFAQVTVEVDNNLGICGGY